MSLIPKNGNPHNPANHRPIPIISKIFERHIHSLLLGFVSINENQWGFLPGHSTVGAVLSAIHDWETHIEAKSEVAAVFFDLSKAFDSVPHIKLLDHLLDLDIPLHIVSLISSYLANRHQVVCVNGACSSMTHVLSGVPQGSVLGPLLFIIYIDKIARLTLSAGTIIIYADDMCLYRPIHSLSDLTTLQSDVESLVALVDDLALTLNVSKCKSITFSRKKNPTPLNLHIHGLPLQHVPSLKYLGFLLSQDLSWSLHINDICSRARKKLGLIYRKFYRFCSDSAALLTLYTAYVRPILEYGASVWDPYLVKDIQALESVQRFATKICLKNWSISYHDRLQLLSIDSLFTRRKCIKLCMLYKIAHSMTAPPFSLTTLDHSHSTRSHNYCFHTQYAHTISFLHSFYNSSIRAWNQLPPEVVWCSSLSSFKRSLYDCTVLPSF